jgi:thiosulfate dehydrogenase
MARNRLAYVIALAVVLVAGGAVLSLVFTRFVNFGAVAAAPATLPAPIMTPAPPPGGAAPEAVAYAPPKIEDAPENIREAVILGANILTDTQKYAGAYVGNDMKCTNCHFNAGVSQGGKNGGLSLVGTSAMYPQYRDRQKWAVDMTVRINDCFQRSENGKVLPPGSKELIGVQAYLQWIAKGIPVYADVPWVKLPAVKSDHQADKTAGQQVYGTKCAPCHGQDGQGTPAAPPVWGDKSYNDGAGMAKAATLAGFALLNMPRGNPDLTAEQAIDVGAFIDGQPRPKFTAAK